MSKLIGTFRDLPHKLHLGGSGKAKASDKQLRQYKEFFELGELCKIGFPDNATTLAHDHQLSLLAVGTKSGEIHIYGAAGHEFSGSHKEASEVKQLHFLPEEGRLVSLTADNRIHKWEVNAPTTEGANWRLEHVADLLAGPADGADGQTAVCLALVGVDSRLWVGYASGSIRLVDAKEWKFTETATSGDALAKGLTEEASSQIHGWGAVVAIEANGKHVAVGYASGTVAILNAADCTLHSLAPGSSELRCLNWQTDGTALYTGHADGSYAVWQADQPAEASRLLKAADNPQTVYGPFPCLPVTRVLHRTAKLGAFTVLTGGMAKNTHADRHTVTLLREQEHVCLDLCSPVVDIALLCSPGDGNTGQAGYDEPHTLLVLCESQLVALDLYGAQWPEFRLPYMTAVTATGAPVTSVRLYGAGTSADRLRAALLTASAVTDSTVAFTNRAWPITGGKSVAPEAEVPAAATEGDAAAPAEGTDSWDLLVTGHEDGSVAFWKVGGAESGTSANLLYSLPTAELFCDAPAEEAPIADSCDFPPFRAVGQKWRRPATDSPNAARFAVTAVELADDCVLVGGATGQATLWRLAGAETGPVEVDVRTVNADIVSPPGKDSRFSWEGPAPLRVREDPWHPAVGRKLFEPATVALAFPPDRVCSLALNVEHGLAALGTGFGLALLDTQTNRCLSTHCTLPQAPATPAAAASASSAGAPTTPTKSGAATASSNGGGSSITKSLRQSFRRLKKLRGGKRQEYTVTTEEGATGGPSTSAAADGDSVAPATDKDKKKKEKKEKEKEKKEKKEDKKAAAAAPAEEKAEEKPEEAKEEEKKEEEPVEVKKEEEPKAASEEPAKSAEEPANLAEADEGAAAASAVATAPEPQKQALTPETGAENTGRVRCLTIADAHLIASGASTPALFAGDRAGRVYAFQVEISQPASGESAGKRQARLAKELHLRHGAPVVAIYVTGEQQQLVVASEQQVKLFSLPSLRPRCKARLLPAEAPARLRACGLAQFRSGTQQLTGLTVEDSLGRLQVLGLPQLKILAQLERADPALLTAGLAFQPAGATNPLAVAVNGQARVRLVRLAAATQQQQGRYVSPAGLELPDWARPAKAPVAAAPAAAAVAAASPAAAVDSASIEASHAAATTDGDQEQHEHEHEHDTDRSHHQVAADITMDDIKEYAAAAPLPPTDTIPESTDEKQEPVPADSEEHEDHQQQQHDDTEAAHQEKKHNEADLELAKSADEVLHDEKVQHHQVAIDDEPASPAELKPAEVKAYDEAAATAGGAGDVAAEQ